MKKKSYKCISKVWLYPGETAGWHFVTIPKDIGQEIKESVGGNRKGFGSVPVSVTIGETSWDTSVFPDKTSGSFLLPLKAKVRAVEEVFVDEKISYEVRIR